MRNGLTGWFDCYGNESKLDECNNTDSKHVQGGSCYPVLVDCSSGSSSGGTNVAAAVSTPLVLLVVGAGVCAAVIVVLYLWRKRKLQQKRFARCVFIYHSTFGSDLGIDWYSFTFLVYTCT